jgi:hypothetical protein
LKFVWLTLLGSTPGVPYWARNCPSAVNFRMWRSCPPLPPIQTLPWPSTVMPWLDCGHV